MKDLFKFMKTLIIVLLVGGIFVTLIYLRNIPKTVKETRFSQEEIIMRINVLYKERVKEWENLERTWNTYKKQNPYDDIKFEIFSKKSTRIINRIEKLDSEIKNLENQLKANPNRAKNNNNN